MLTPSALRSWYVVHKWTSLVSTLFLLLLCISGLPLIFHHELDHALGNVIDPPESAAGVAPGERANLDAIVAAARARKPEHAVQFVSRDADEPDAWFVGLGETISAPETAEFYTFDARSGQFVHEYPLNRGVLNLLFRLHTDMFAGLPGTLFLGLMGMLLAASLVSGVLVYGPFMRKLSFGSVRYERSTRTQWLDLHNLLGIATALWLFTVGVTGVVNTLSRPILGYWQMTELASMTSPYAGRPPLEREGSAQRAVDAARAAAPDSELSFIAFPGNPFASPHHYVAFMHGSTPLTSRLLTPILVDAETSAVVDQRALPWYALTLLLSQPLHFGDYGGLPLKVLWALLDVVAIVVLGSGVYLWLKKWRVPVESRLDVLQAEAAE
ncbi:MAG TPA: PepSY domain-containing protein [Polyangiaceae bacterium]|nr:PepSY domain-containing protein [Polyangiaceae bacterium]